MAIPQLNSTSERGIWGWSLVGWLTGVPFLLYIAFLVLYGYTETGVRAVVAWSAKISFAYFWMAFVAGAVHRRLRHSFSFWWLMNRRFFGISFALNFIVHLFFLGQLQWSFHPVFNLAATTSLLAGGLAFFFTFLMLFTSFETTKDWLGRRRWKVLHTVGSYWIWTIFLSTYTKKVLHVGVLFLPFVGLLLVALYLRLTDRFRKRNKLKSF